MPKARRYQVSLDEETYEKLKEMDLHPSDPHPSRMIKKVLKERDNLKESKKKDRKEIATLKGQVKELSQSKSGAQPSDEDLTFDIDIVSQFCSFPVPDPTSTHPTLNYICSNKSRPIDVLKGKLITTTLCRTCDKARQDVIDSESVYALYRKALKHAGGRQKVNMVLALSKHIQTLKQDRDFYRTQWEDLNESYKGNLAYRDAENDKIRRESNDELARNKESYRTQLRKKNDHISNLNDQIKSIREEKDKLNTKFQELSLQRLEIADYMPIIQKIKSYPNWEERLQTEENLDKLTKTLEKQNTNIVFLEHQHQIDKETISDLTTQISDLRTRYEAVHNDLETMKGALEVKDGEIVLLHEQLEDAKETNKTLEDEASDNVELRNVIDSQNKELDFIQRTIVIDIDRILDMNPFDRDSALVTLKKAVIKKIDHQKGVQRKATLLKGDTLWAINIARNNNRVT